MPRDAVVCAGRWYVVGALADPSGATRPAAWSSPDASTWTPLRMTARSPYGAENVLSAVGCRDGRIAAVGAKSGGVHGNPRVSSWRQVADGSLVEVPAEFELFGGPDAVNVGRIVGGRRGWLIAGNRASGAAAWLSLDATGFGLVSGVPGLAVDGAGRPWAADAAAVPGGWLLVGSVLPAGRADVDPAVWASADGRVWRREVLSTDGVPEDLQRVVPAGERLVAVGRRGAGFGAWVAGADGWRAAGGFGRAAGGAPPRVLGLAAVSGGVLVAGSDGAAASLWFSTDGDGWSGRRAPVALPAGADATVALAGSGDRVLLLVDGGAGGGVWTARLPAG
ncbi:hypothetical protein GA0070564_108203 [Micromonospora mirobrigensis]|uniref:Uncharacterized protein n=2 Tax=Micromonospora mirobrigensis TaxID=262898 RepID=A0A1C5AAK1_9ACTN|nr:hypothetical protein GA0070564_108203 [Micromonospora mirobrigensis]